MALLREIAIIGGHQGWTVLHLLKWVLCKTLLSAAFFQVVIAFPWQRKPLSLHRDCVQCGPTEHDCGVTICGRPSGYRSPYKNTSDGRREGRMKAFSSVGVFLTDFLPAGSGWVSWVYSGQATLQMSLPDCVTVVTLFGGWGRQRELLMEPNIQYSTLALGLVFTFKIIKKWLGGPIISDTREYKK